MCLPHNDNPESAGLEHLSFDVLFLHEEHNTIVNEIGNVT